MLDQSQHIEQLKTEAEYWKKCYNKVVNQVNKTLEAQSISKRQSWNQKAKLEVFKEEAELKKLINPKQTTQATIQWLGQ